MLVLKKPMSVNSFEEKQRVLDALRLQRDHVFYAREKLLDEEASPDGQTVRELREELHRLGSERRTNPEGWSPEQEERYQHLHQNPRYLNELVPLTTQWVKAEGKYRNMFRDLERSGQAARSEAALLVLDALRLQRDHVFYAREKLLDEEASPDGQTVRELIDELHRLGDERRNNPEGWSPEQEDRYLHLRQNPRYLNEFVPLTRQWLEAERKYRNMLRDLDLERSRQAARSEAAPPSKKVPEGNGAVIGDAMDCLWPGPQQGVCFLVMFLLNCVFLAFIIHSYHCCDAACHVSPV